MIRRSRVRSIARSIARVKKDGAWLHHPAPVVTLLVGASFFVAGAATLLLLASYFLEGNHYVLGRLVACALLFVYVLAAYKMVRLARYTIAAGMLIAMYAGIAAIILWYWGIHATVGMLLLGFVIVLAGVTLGARYIIYTAGGVTLLLVGLQLALQFNFITPNTASLSDMSGYGDVVTYSAIFLIFSLVAWISGRKMELSLASARRAEAELVKEKLLLEDRVAEQAAILRKTQLEEMEQLYRFAELGQISTLLLHELANNLAVLTLDMDDLGKRHRQSESIDRAKESIAHLELLVHQVRHYVKRHGETKAELFAVEDAIRHAVDSVRLKAEKNGVAIATQFNDKKVRLKGEPQRLSQVIAVLLSNAVDAYETSSADTKRRVQVRLKKEATRIIVEVIDSGSGISSEKQKVLFTPFTSSKPSGMGIGLYIAREITETHFGGSLRYEPKKASTVFSLELPLQFAPKRGGNSNGRPVETHIS